MQRFTDFVNVLFKVKIKAKVTFVILRHHRVMLRQYYLNENYCYSVMIKYLVKKILLKRRTSFLTI